MRLEGGEITVVRLDPCRTGKFDDDRGGGHGHEPEIVSRSTPPCRPPASYGP